MALLAKALFPGYASSTPSSRSDVGSSRAPLPPSPPLPSSAPSRQVPEFRVSYAIQTDKLDALYQKLKPSGVTMTALLAKVGPTAAALVLTQGC